MSNQPTNSIDSLELCKELYSLSGWDNAYFRWFRDTHKEYPMGDFVSDGVGTTKQESKNDENNTSD